MLRASEFFTFAKATMVQEIKEVLRLLMLLTKQNKEQVSKSHGGLLVLVWIETDRDVQSLYCTVAAAGPWCAGVQMEKLHPDVRNRLCPYPGSCPEPDIEDLFAFTDMYGPLKVFLSFRINNPGVVGPKLYHQIQTFFHTFSLTNAEIQVQFKLRMNQNIFQREYNAQEYLRVHLSGYRPLFLDVSVKAQAVNISPLECCENRLRYHGGHPDVGSSLVLSIPPKAMEQGLFGTVTLQSVSLLQPCLQQYPNAATNLSQIKVLFFSPSNVPVKSPVAFMQNLPDHLHHQELGLSDGLTFREVTASGETVYKVEQLDCLETSEKSSLFCFDQNLVLFLFLQHTDPFMTDISDIMDAEMQLEHHLEDILIYNKQTVTNAVVKELRKTLMVQKDSQKGQEKMKSACDVILNSALSIISCSSNMEFRNTCLDSMKVHSTRELSVAFSEALKRTIFCKFVPKRMCFPDQSGRKLGNYKHMRAEM